VRETPVRADALAKAGPLLGGSAFHLLEFVDHAIVAAHDGDIFVQAVLAIPRERVNALDLFCHTTILGGEVLKGFDAKDLSVQELSLI
jgi:hypothetical protein